MSTETHTRSRRSRLVGLLGFGLVGAALLAVVAVVVGVDYRARGASAPSDAAGGPVTVPASSTAKTSTSPTPAGKPTVAIGRTGSGTPRPLPRLDTSTVVWPWKASPVRYEDPVEAARGFATEFAGFTAPVVGPFLQGDSRSGEVEVRPRRDGPVTTVLVRQLADLHWWVLGSTSSSITLDSPGAGERISSPVRLTGKADTYEGHVDVRIRQDGSGAAIGTGYVTGCQGELCPFAGEVRFSRPTAAAGAVVLSTTGGQDDELWQVTVVRVSFRPTP